MAVVETRELQKHFGHVKAVDGVNLAIQEGEFLVLLGPSGCGKTTTMRMIAGLEKPTSGDILIGGRKVNDLPPRARKVAMVFQSYALYPHMTVYNNIAFPLKAEKMSKSGIQNKVVWAAGIFNIGHLLDRRPRQLSGGERQRVALARAIVREPNVFLLDEPLSNLDAKLRALARDELKQYQERVGTTTIYVTHDQAEAMGLGDRIAVMYDGKVRQIGPPREDYEDPTDTFVATFLGSPPMNLVGRGDHLVGFRPENLLPAELVSGNGDKVTARLDVARIEYLSGDRHVYGTLTGIGEETRVIARLPATITTPLEDGDKRDFAVHERDLRFFDAETGKQTAAQPARA